jgi:hypothetical protein
MLLLLQKQLKGKKSFIIVISDLDYNAVPDTLTVSILEA